MGLEASDWKVFHDFLHTMFYGMRAILILLQDLAWLAVVIALLIWMARQIK